MPRNAGTFVENSFVKGLITEATGLNFPEQAVTQTDNCVFNEIGTVHRRYGFDYEFGHSFIDEDDARVTTTYRWDAAAGSGDNSLVVVQIADTLYFYLLDEGAVSDNQIDSLDLTTFVPSGSTLDVGDFECQFASGKGFLFVSNPAMDSIYVEFDEASLSVSANEITIQTRDFRGLDDGLALVERPAVLSETHEYNLHNQGWNTVGTIDLEGGGQDFPLDNWDTERADFPSNVDIWWRFGDLFAPNETRFDPGNTPAPKGHFILNYYEQDPNAVQPNDTSRSWSGLDIIRSSGFERASTIEFFAGRVWYSGTKGTGYSNEVLFSQIIERDEQIGYCYQNNDPCVQDNFDLLPSDGGVVLIPDSGTIVKLFAFEDSLLIFSTNGVWRVTGSEGVGFRANDFSVIKVSSVPCLTASSFVSIEGTPSFWNNEGIYVLKADQGLGTQSVASITDSTIKQFFDAIPLASRRYVKGVYNRFTRVLTWVYRSTAPTTVRERYSYDRVLNLNTLSNAFYGWTVDISDVVLSGIVVAMSGEVFSAPEIVTNAALQTVTDAALETVYAFDPSESRLADVTKYLVAISDGGSGFRWTFAEPWQNNYLDWFSFDSTGLAYESSFTTGYKVHGEGQRKVSPTYINLFFDTSDVDSAIDFRSIWKFANTGSTGKWSSAQRVVTTSNDYDYVRRRIKSRGSGEAYQFQVVSVAGTAFFLIGWAVFETSNAGV